MAKIIKRIIDFLFALIIGILAIPVFFFAICIIYIASPEDSPIFKQIRVGYKGEKFIIYKLRTMTNGKDENGKLLPEEQRLKKWGRLIRATNIDEITQIWNIIQGQMSWIGPRPLLPHEMLVMTREEQKIRQSVLPGISGWEAVNEKKTSTRTEMAQYDLYYVKNWSLFLDIKIFVKTLAIIFLRLRPVDSIRAPKILDEEIKTSLQKNNKEFVK